MERCRFLGTVFAVSTLSFLLATVPGYPNKSGPTKPTDPLPPSAEVGNGAGLGAGAGGRGDKKQAVVVKTTDGVIKGRVVYDGTQPTPAKLKLEGHADAPNCHKGPDTDQTWLVSKNGDVANVAVFVEPADGGFIALDETQVEMFKTSPSIDQPHCVYVPAVVGIFAGYKTQDGKQHLTGIPLLVKNSGDIAHNTKISGEPKYNPTISMNILPGAKNGQRYPIYYQKTPLNVVCDKHNWMRAKVVAFNHPFFAITDKDGNFEIKNAPSGVDVIVKTWHEDATSDSKKLNVKAGVNDAGTLKIKAAS
jgi:hypothetical protein